MKEQYITRTIPVIGMSCSSCALQVEKKLQSIEGVLTAVVSLPSRSATIQFDKSLVTPLQLKEAISKIGYDLVIEEEKLVENIEKQVYNSLLIKTFVSCFFSLIVMALSMKWIDIFNKDITYVLLFVISLFSIVYCGKDYYVRAIKQLKHGSANMDTLIALSTFIAFSFSAVITLFNTVWVNDSFPHTHTFYDASVMILSFSLVGRVLEERAKNSASSAIRGLIEMTPKTAWVLYDDNLSEVPITTLVKGDLIEVEAGRRVPVDGVIVKSLTDKVFIDESMITGEPIPTEKTISNKVMCGTICKQGKFIFKAQEVGERTMLSHIIKMVQEAQNSKAPVQRIVDKIALFFVPIIILLSAFTFLLWLYLGGISNLYHAILSGVSVLVIACPCAMGLATPAALMVGMGKAAKHHILIKDATALESIRRITAMIIDKTGTLTIPNKNIDFTNANELSFEQRETLKPHAFEAMQALQKKGIDIYLMSGDKEAAAQYWAKKVGIKNYKSEVLPQDKENLVIELQAKGHCVAMVGDGINDSQALARADVSIAMSSGTDIAMDIAQATLIGNDLKQIVNLLTLSKKTISIIHQNLFWAFGYNLICIPLAAGLPLLLGFHWQITPMWASALMALSSISVILNSLRLKLMKL